MRIELTSPYSRTVTADLKSGTGTSSVTSPLIKKVYLRHGWMARKFNDTAAALVPPPDRLFCLFFLKNLTPLFGVIIEQSCFS